MDGVSFFRELARESRELLEGTMGDVTSEQARWAPPGTALPIGAHYAHVVMSQDMGLHGMFKGTPPLAASTWAGKTGCVEPPPPFGQSWDRWARQAIDLKQLKQYAQAVYAASDEYFASLTDADLARPVDLSAAGFGMRDAVFILVNGWITNVSLHCGEIACLKGLQGANGYPM